MACWLSMLYLSMVAHKYRDGIEKNEDTKEEVKTRESKDKY